MSVVGDMYKLSRYIVCLDHNIASKQWMVKYDRQMLIYTNAHILSPPPSSLPPSFPPPSPLSLSPSLSLPLSFPLSLPQHTPYTPRELADVDKDGRLTAEEFAIAMHLLEKAKAGLTLPPTLPASLSPDTTKFNTVARSSPQAKKKVGLTTKLTVFSKYIGLAPSKVVA